MTTAQELGTIEKVDIRQVWPMEDANFTPWLGDNLDLLGAELGLDLELIETEAHVGTFKLDVRAHDAYTGGEVVIENQYGNTDHSHLGQLLTYASGFDAQAVVWIAERFRDEHREALDYLNHRTGEDTKFFGVEIELWKIGDSRPAVNFKLVSTPNEWRKVNVNRTDGRRETNRMFHQGFLEKLDEQSLRLKGARAGVSSYRVLEHPVKDVRYAAIWHDGKPGLEIIADSPDRDWNMHVYRSLKRDKEGIQAGLAESQTEEWFAWDELFQKSGIRVAIYRAGNVYQDREAWDEFQEWMIRKLLLFKEVLEPRLAELAD